MSALFQTIKPMLQWADMTVSWTTGLGRKQIKEAIKRNQPQAKTSVKSSNQYFSNLCHMTRNFSLPTKAERDRRNILNENFFIGNHHIKETHILKGFFQYRQAFPNYSIIPKCGSLPTYDSVIE